MDSRRCRPLGRHPGEFGAQAGDAVSQADVYSAHPLVIIDPAADPMLEAMLSPRLQDIAWTRHGFRGRLGQPAGNGESAVKGLLPQEVSSVLPMPDADVMLALLAKLAV